MKCALSARRLLTALAAAAMIFAGEARGEDWPQWRGANRDGVWNETGLIDKFDGPELKSEWRASIGAGYSGPTVADGRVYVMDRLVKPTQIERVHCFDAETGRNIWTHEYECAYRNVSYQGGPRASVTIDAGKAYSFGTMGNLFCFDAATGDVLWEKDCATEYKTNMPIWGLASSPLIVDDLVILQVGGDGDYCLVALDKNTGAERWHALEDRASYSSPILIDHAGKRVMVCWTGDSVALLNPLSGDLYWSHPFPPKKMPLIIATPVLHNGHLYFSSFYDGSILLKLIPGEVAAEVVWRRVGESEMPGQTDSIQSIISTPIAIGDHIYGVDSFGQFRCIEMATGDRVWEDDTATPAARWSTIHFVANGDRVWMFNERGDLIIGKLSPDGFEEISRANMIAPTTVQLPKRGGVCWSHPAFADKHVFQRNDEELVCASLEAPSAFPR